MKLTVSKVLAWLTGGFFVLVGLIQSLYGMLTFSPTNILAALIALTVATVVTPKSRQLIKEKYDLEFSKWLLVGIAIVGLIMTNILVGVSTNTTQTPSEVVNTYNQEQYSSNPDYDKMYELLHKPEVSQTEEEWKEWIEERDEKQKSVATYTYEGIENSTVKNETAVVFWDVEVETIGSFPTTLTHRTQLVESNETWRINDTQRVRD